MAVVQLAERSPPSPEVNGSDKIANFYLLLTGEKNKQRKVLSSFGLKNNNRLITGLHPLINCRYAPIETIH